MIRALCFGAWLCDSLPPSSSTDFQATNRLQCTRPKAGAGRRAGANESAVWRACMIVNGS